MLGCIAAASSLQAPLRPPSVPLVTHDPYFSVWSPADHANDHDTTHWTGRPQPLTATVSVDGRIYRLLGKDASEAARQTSLRVTATQTEYTFEVAGVRVGLRFTSPLLPDDLDLFSRPVTYVGFESTSVDGQAHRVAWEFTASGLLAVDRGEQKVRTTVDRSDRLNFARVGTIEQPTLQKRGDDLRIDWGYAYLAGERGQEWAIDAQGGDGAATDCRLRATRTAKRAKNDHAWLAIAYDDVVGLRYFDAELKPFWRRKRGVDGKSILESAARDHDAIIARCDAFDSKLEADLREVGGVKYAQVATLAYRQAVAGNKLVADAKGRPLLFPKENFSNGCIGTVDVIYPMAPLWFLLGPDLAKAMLTPVLDYGASKRWKFPFAPHDLGTYPHATGQVYGGGEQTEDNQMPVEESGNMILLVAALAEIEGNAEFARKYWPNLVKWAGYLKDEGLDPANQLCTDDFMGHLAHNANLSVKAILALGAIGKLAHRLGDAKVEREYAALAKDYAAQWVGLARDGDHTKLAFDRPATWSTKYNMVWDDLLGLELFSKATKRAEVEFYKTKLNRYGLPLDNRSAGMKIDWLCWAATLTRDKSDFETLIAPMWDFLNETVDRVPICDWVHTDTNKHIGMIARPVMGGAFLPLLHDRAIWSRWFGQGVRSSGPWAPIPIWERETVVPTAQTSASLWKFTTDRPRGDWFKPGFDDSKWPNGTAGFGTVGTPGAIVRTTWNTSDIWLRRECVIPKVDPKALKLSMHHDEDVEVYINGILALSRRGYVSGYVEEPIRPEALKAIKFGESNLIAVTCHQTVGAQYIDVGFKTVKAP